MEAPSGIRDLECVIDPRRALALLHPMRREILRLARLPASATELAGRLGLPRQRVNYHVRELARSGFLRRAGRRRRRNMVEQRYVATARGYVLAPEVLGPLATDWREIEDTASAAYLLALTEQVRRDLARVWKSAGAGGKRVPILSVKAQFRFESPEQRAEFARALREAVVGVVARHTAPSSLEGGGPAPGRPYRLIVGCYPYGETEDE